MIKKVFVSLLLCISISMLSNAQNTKHNDSQQIVYENHLKNHPYFQDRFAKKSFRGRFEFCKVVFPGCDDSIPPCQVYYFDTSSYDMNNSYCYTAFYTANDNPELYQRFSPAGYPFAYNSFINSCYKCEDSREAMRWCENELQKGYLVSISSWKTNIRKKKRTESYKLIFFMKSFDFSPENIENIEKYLVK